MTVIVGVHHPEHGACMAADRLSTNGGGLAYLTPPKIHRIGPRLVGVAGYPLLLRGARLDTPPEETLSDEYWAWEVAERISTYARDRGHGAPYDSINTQQINLLVIGFSGLWVITAGVEVEPVVNVPEHGGFAVDAIGSGASVAMGAAVALIRQGLTRPDALASEAAATACRLVPSCGGPVQLEWATQIRARRG